MRRPLSLNSHIYAYNNPLNYLDPTGLCGAELQTNGGVLTGSIIECFKLEAQLEQTYAINIQGEWTFAEMRSVKLGLTDIAYGLGGAGYFQTVFNNTTITRSPEDYFSGFSSTLDF